MSGRFYRGGVSFQPPRGWCDESVVAFVRRDGAREQPFAPSLVVTSEPLRDTETLHAHLMRRVMALATRVDDLVVCESGETTLGGLPAARIRYTWVTDAGLIEQTMTAVARAVGPAPFVTTFTATCAYQDIEAARAEVDGLLASVRFTEALFASAAPERTPATPAPRSSSADVAPPSVPIPGVSRRWREA